MRAGVGDASLTKGSYRRNCREAQNCDRENQNREHRHFYVIRFDLFAEVLRSAADHETGEKNCDDNEHDHAVKAGADAAEHDFAEKNVNERNHAAQRREGIVHSVNGAATGVGGDRGENRSARNAEAKLLAFEISCSGGSRRRCAKSWRRMCLGSVGGKHRSEEQGGHCTPDGPAVVRGTGQAAKRIREATRDRENHYNLKKIRERRGIFVRMCAVGVEKAATICAEFFDGFL